MLFILLVREMECCTYCQFLDFGSIQGSDSKSKVVVKLFICHHTDAELVLYEVHI